MARWSFNVFLAIVLFFPPIYLMAYEHEDINPFGRPSKYSAGKVRKCAIWYQDGWWNVSTTSGNPIQFVGSIKITGDKYTGRFEGLERPVDKSGKPKAGYDHILPHKDGKGFDFVFNVGGTSGDSDTIQFKVGEKATSIEFVIIGGGDRDPKIIYIGKNSMNPSRIPFSLAAIPTQTEPEAAPATPPKKAAPKNNFPK